MTQKALLFICTILLGFSANTQTNALLSLGTGYELKHKAIPAQLTAGVSIGRSEISVGYTAFLHKEDAKIPKVIFFACGHNTSTDDLKIIPLFGVGLITSTVYEKDNELIMTSKQFKMLYGLKVKKQIGYGGLFISYEHFGLNYLNAGMFVRIEL